MNRISRFVGLALLMQAILPTAGCNPHDSARDGGPKKLKIGFVLHGQNEFTGIIGRGAKDAAKAEGVDIEVDGPAAFVTPEEVGIFEGMVQKKVAGLVVVPMPGDVWITPIRQATEAGIPVLTTNVPSPDSAATAWFGIDEYAGGKLLAEELRKSLKDAGKLDGQIVVGMCSPGLSVLVERYAGFKKGMEGTRYQISDPKDVNLGDTDNYSAWEGLAGANPKVVAFVGLCAMDLPNLALLKKRTGGTWLLAGYDLGEKTANSIKDGLVQVVIGQHPYLQGYLPVLAMARHLRDKQPLPKGWIPIEAEVVTAANIGSIFPRETDKAEEKKWYADYIPRHFTDLQSLAKPMPQKHD